LHNLYASVVRFGRWDLWKEYQVGQSPSSKSPSRKGIVSLHIEEMEIGVAQCLAIKILQNAFPKIIAR
jgi:hypothetical protein